MAARRTDNRPINLVLIARQVHSTASDSLFHSVSFQLSGVNSTLAGLTHHLPGTWKCSSTPPEMKVCSSMLLFNLLICLKQTVRSRIRRWKLQPPHWEQVYAAQKQRCSDALLCLGNTSRLFSLKHDTSANWGIISATYRLVCERTKKTAQNGKTGSDAIHYRVPVLPMMGFYYT